MRYRGCSRSRPAGVRAAATFRSKDSAGMLPAGSTSPSYTTAAVGSGRQQPAVGRRGPGREEGGQRRQELVVVAAALADPVAGVVDGGGRQEDAGGVPHDGRVVAFPGGLLDRRVAAPDEFGGRCPVHPAQRQAGLADRKQDLVPGLMQRCQQGKGRGLGTHAKIGGEGARAATGQAGRPGQSVPGDARPGALQQGRRQRGTPGAVACPDLFLRHHAGVPSAVMQPGKQGFSWRLE